MSSPSLTPSDIHYFSTFFVNVNTLTTYFFTFITIKKGIWIMEMVELCAICTTAAAAKCAQKGKIGHNPLRFDRFLCPMIDCFSLKCRTVPEKSLSPFNQACQAAKSNNDGSKPGVNGISDIRLTGESLSGSMEKTHHV